MPIKIYYIGAITNLKCVLKSLKNLIRKIQTNNINTNDPIHIQWFLSVDNIIKMDLTLLFLVLGNKG